MKNNRQNSFKTNNGIQSEECRKSSGDTSCVAFPPKFTHIVSKSSYMSKKCPLTNIPSSFPEAVNLSLKFPEMANEYLKSLYETVVVKDIVKRNNLRKFDTLKQVLNFLFDSVRSVVSPNNITDVLHKNVTEKLSHNTVLKYLQYFTESYLIYPVRLYNIKGKRLLQSNYKYYVVDWRLKSILQSNAYDADLGHKLENVVYLELLSRGGEVFAGRTDNGEVDFVVQKYDGQKEYYQVAYTVSDEKTLNRELSSLRKIRDSYPKYLLTMDFFTNNSCRAAIL